MTNIYLKKKTNKLFETQKSYMDPVGIAKFYDIYNIFFLLVGTHILKHKNN